MTPQGRAWNSDKRNERAPLAVPPLQRKAHTFLHKSRASVAVALREGFVFRTSLLICADGGPLLWRVFAGGDLRKTRGLQTRKEGIQVG